MAKDDSDDIRIRLGRSRGAGRRANPRDLPFTRQVELAVRRAGGNPGRIGRGGAGRKGGGSGRFNAHGRGAKALASFPRDSGGWQRDSIGRFRARRMVVKVLVVKLAPQRGSRGPKVRGVSKAADAHLLLKKKKQRDFFQLCRTSRHRDVLPHRYRRFEKRAPACHPADQSQKSFCFFFFRKRSLFAMGCSRTDTEKRKQETFACGGVHARRGPAGYRLRVIFLET